MNLNLCWGKARYLHRGLGASAPVLTLVPVLVLLLLAGTGCRSTYYAAYEKFGVHKRDLLKKNVAKARDDQEAAQQQFKDALTRLKEITGFQGGELEKAYNQLKSEYEDCESRSKAVSSRIREVENVARDLFAEWEQENQQISTASLRTSSKQQLDATRAKYEDMHSALVAAERSMTPVLRQFNDYVLFLKHNLNAAAIASLKGEAVNVQAEIAKLIEQMNRSIARADEFVKSMPD